MQITFKIPRIKPAYLITLYDLIEECNCKTSTWIEEEYDRSIRKYVKIRYVDVIGSSTMVSWLFLRMVRYQHITKILSEQYEEQCIMV